jgi:hypothetical protein
MTHEIIRSLETIQDQVKQELLNVRTYRAFLAVGQAIEEISEVEEIVRSLSGIRSQVIDRLHDVREYRALLAVQKSVLDISEVLGILEESSRKRAEAAFGNGAIPAPTGQAVDGSKTLTPFGGAASQSETVAVAHPPLASPAIMVDQTAEQPPEPTGATVEAASANVAHDGSAAYQFVMNAISPSSAVMADQPHEQEQSPQPNSEAIEIAAGKAAHEGEAAASQSEMHAVEHPPSPSAAVIADQTLEQEQPQPSPGETAENVAINVVHEGSAEELEDVGVTKVA